MSPYCVRSTNEMHVTLMGRGLQECDSFFCGISLRSNGNNDNIIINDKNNNCNDSNNNKDSNSITNNNSTYKYLGNVQIKENMQNKVKNATK